MENIPPPPYDGEIIEENNELPDYLVPYIDPLYISQIRILITGL